MSTGRNVKLVTYIDLIKALKVRCQAFRSKRETWEKSYLLKK